MVDVLLSLEGPVKAEGVVDVEILLGDVPVVNNVIGDVLVDDCSFEELLCG